jgi:hypothetical protein
MTLEDALYMQLTSYSPLNALIGGRVYALVLNEKVVLPAITYQRISTGAIKHRSGYGLEQVRFQIDGWSMQYPEAVTLRKEIRNAMFVFTRPSAPRVDATLFLDDRDLREPATARFRASIDFMIWADEEF